MYHNIINIIISSNVLVILYAMPVSLIWNVFFTNSQMYVDVWLSACRLSCFSRVWLFATLWTEAHQAPLSMGFSRQASWSGLLCPPPGPSSRDRTCLIHPLHWLAGRFFTTSTTWEARVTLCFIQLIYLSFPSLRPRCFNYTILEYPTLTVHY